MIQGCSKRAFIQHASLSRAGRQLLMLILFDVFGVGNVESKDLRSGQASGYVLGKLAIEEWRDRVHSALGDKFELASFHDVILGSGGIPLQVLETLVDRFIECTLTD